MHSKPKSSRYAPCPYIIDMNALLLLLHSVKRRKVSLGELSEVLPAEFCSVPAGVAGALPSSAICLLLAEPVQPTIPG